ncbi:DNA/RNA non-specific endonuclease [Streptococcus dysgalactiae subsp. dysgalactiae]|uniref:DNA/RNA non-specific endonuclease n=1 Tax=Streptococcus dysgalactiae TaxID=1334 RepID=UPI0001F86698|nr:DNA/RNA non-specific endonuclease [Streptococcus dysgalactiae]EFY02227.1 streptodornase D type, SdzD [Streptococcus dysgalactiae subsp. dysgalactiae ATCC 27957]MCB2847764.1 DNA/RNA non-specific endonuclease [Streptococcus dysgalactiae subsp. dysgalactiae]
MSKLRRKWLSHSLVALAMTLSLGFAPNAQPHDSVTYAQETAVTQDWTLAQYPDYYVIEGKSAIQKEAFPQLKTTTEKVYKKSGRSTKRVTVSDLQYADLDGYNRSGVAYGIITKDMIDMSAGSREKWENDYNPSGWFSYKFKADGRAATDNDYKHSPRQVKRIPNNQEVSIILSNGKVRHGYLFDRSHLIADSLGGRPYRNNLITGTRTQNVGNNDRKGGMQYIENKVLTYINQNPSVHVYYKAEPVYVGTELVPRYVVVSALSSDGVIDEKVRVFNTANGFTIDYQNGGLLSDIMFEEETMTDSDDTLTEDTKEPNTDEEGTDQISPDAATKDTTTDLDNQRIVYVASNGSSPVYWYHKENLPAGVNLDRLVEMTEQDALSRDKKHSSTEPTH